MVATEFFCSGQSSTDSVYTGTQDSVKAEVVEIPAMLTPSGHSFLRLNQCGGRGSILVDFPL